LWLDCWLLLLEVARAELELSEVNENLF